MSDKVKRKYVKHDHEERVMAIKKVLEEGWSIRAAARLTNANPVSYTHLTLPTTSRV